jgi:glycosyltransferase involved in cell wall biosynthesis
MKIIISPLTAVSVINQAELIKKLLTQKGYDVVYKNTISIYDINDERNKAFLWFTLATVTFLGDAVFPYLYCSKPKAVYVTIEGIPTKANILCSNIPKLDLIAVSNFAKECLTQAGLNVIDVVHHAIDWEKCQKLREESKTLEKKWREEFKDRTIFLYVGRNDPRKGLDRLAKAISIANAELKDQTVYLIYSEGELSTLEDLPNVIRIGNFGSMDYDQVLRMIGACDYLLFPSVCEGFGLPLLEANALGRPVIHAWFPPFDEFSSKEFNFTFGYQRKVLVNQGNAQYWVFHEYRPELLAEMIKFAVITHQENRDEYNEYCQKAIEHTKNWDYKLIYPKLLKYLGVE